jgi:hypothetical protein
MASLKGKLSNSGIFSSVAVLAAGYGGAVSLARLKGPGCSDLLALPCASVSSA